MNDQQKHDGQQALEQLEQDLKKKQSVADTQQARQEPQTRDTKETSVEAIEPPTKPAKTKLLWLFTLFNLLVLVLFVLAAFWFQQRWLLPQLDKNQQLNLQQQDLEQDIQRQSKQLAQLELDKQTLQQQLNQSDQSMRRAEQSARQAAEQALANRKILGELSGRRPADWLLAEADYLVRMAGRKLWLEDDVNTAILMLQSADSRLQDLADPSLIPLRELVLQDVQALQQINPVSLANVALSLGALVPQVNNLPLALPQIPDIQQTDKGLSDSPSQWRENLGKIWDFFREDLIRYQPNSDTIRPMLSEKQQWLAKENLKFTLLQAKSAILAEQYDLYQQALQNAQALLLEHYDLNSQQVSQFHQQLEALQRSEVKRQYPAQLASSLPLQDLLKQRLQGAYGNGVESL